VPLRFSDQRPPIPPLDLIQRVVPPFGPEHSDATRVAFDEAPMPQLAGLERALAVVGCEFSDFERLLDFGCGPGRYARHLGALAETTEIHGADIDAQAIDWLKRNVPYGQFEAIPPEPPTAYPNDHFDLVINHSVFTHLPEALQDAWMAELRRITLPGGVLLLTVHSTPQWNVAIHDMENGGEKVEHLRSTLEQDGILFISEDHFIGSTHPDFYHTTFHAPWYVFERWTQWFDLAAYVPLGSDTQDLVVMRRRADDAPVQRPIGHAAATHTAPVRTAAAGRPEARAALGKVKRRALALLRRSGGGQGLADTDRDRELRMLRVGMYELGQRISMVSDELHTELHDALRERDDAPRS
jgi:SAM-dependent methyltransferase